MDFISEEERQAHSERRDKLYNALQKLIAGHDLPTAIEAACDNLAVMCVMLSGADRAAAHSILDRLMPGMKRHADNNLDRVAEQMARMGGPNAN